MKIVFYSSPSHRHYADRLTAYLQELEIPFHHYTREWLETTDFYKQNKTILDQKRGNGYWAWKPYIIMNALQEEERILYLDASILFNKEDKENVYHFTNFPTAITSVCTSFLNREWTDPRCLKAMNIDIKDHWDSCQIWAGIIACTPLAFPILHEWLHYCTMEEAVCDHEEYKTHRHDQSILSFLFLKYGIKCTHTNMFADR